MPIKITAVLAMAIMLTGCGAKSRLVLYTPGFLFPQEILDGFEKDTGFKVKQINYESSETMIAGLAAKSAKFGLVIAGNTMIGNVINDGLAHKIDRYRLPNYSNIDPRFQKQFYDPKDEYTIPYGAELMTIVYDRQKTGVSINSYLDLWHPALLHKLGIMDNSRVITGIALKIMKESCNSENPALIRRAGEFLNSLAQNTRYIGKNPEEALLSGDTAVALMYTSRIKTAKAAKPDFRVVFPREGIIFSTMQAFIPIRCQNLDAAYAFLDYILDTRRGAACFTENGYFSTLSESGPFIEAEFQDFLTFPANYRNFDAMEMIQNISEEAQALHDKVWTDFLTAAGH